MKNFKRNAKPKTVDTVERERERERHSLFNMESVYSTTDSLEKKKRIKTTAMLVLVILALLCVAIICINPNTRQSILNSINGNINNANEETQEIQVYDDGSADLTDDSAVVSSVAIVNKTTGTGPFDDNDDPGNDSSATNNIVRSFDTVTYELEANMAVNNTDHGSEDAKNYASFRGGIINVEATIPEENAGTMKWSLEDMAWAEGTGKLSEDGLTFTGQYKMEDTKITVPGKQTVSLVLKVEGAANETQLNPTFKLWMQGNETDSSNPNYEAKEVRDDEGIKISAKPGFNIKLKQGSRYQVKTSVDFGDGNGEVSGRMYGYGVILQLYNPDTEKGLKGLEYPQGDITFDIATKLEAVETIDGKQVTTDITDLATPKLWNYKINVKTETGNQAYGNIPDRNMYFGSYTSFDDGCGPYGMYNEGQEENSIYNSGNISMQENGNVINTIINNYEFNGIFPKYNAYYNISNPSIVYGENIGCFSAGYFQIFVPDNEETLKDRDYYLTVEDKDMVVNTVSNQEVTKQVVTDDDTVRMQHYVKKPGKYTHDIRIKDDEGNSINGIDTINLNGKARVGKNQTFQIMLSVYQNTDNDKGTEFKSVNKLVKFDGDGLEPILFDDGEKVHFSIDTMPFKIWYVTKKDGTNWVDETERNNANIEDLNMYETLEDIPEGYICVGMYFESQGGIVNIPENYWDDNLSVIIRFKINDIAEIGKTYGIVQDDYCWTETLDRTTQTATNPDAEYPEPVFSAHNQQYKKTQYDENGQIITGTHNGGYWGNTVLVVGADSSIGVKSIDEDSGAKKVTYDLGRNENVVTLQTTPTLSDLDSQIPSGITGATVRIKETLPTELTYVPGSSNYGEPIDRIENSDGSITYIWDIYDCTVGESIEPLVIKAEINPDVTNGTTLNVTSVIEPDRELIGLSALEFRTASVGIQVVNLSSHSLTKVTSTRIIENNGEITYKVTYQNKTDYSMPDFQLLDILPYNGDGRGTAYNGTYTLKDVKVTQTAGESSVSNDNLSLYTTTNVDARKITPKDEGIGVTEAEGGIWQEKELGSSIEEPVTVVALKGEIAPNTRVEMEITLKTNNNRGADIYSNSVTAQTSKATEVITSTNAQTDVVKRTIEGMLWYDTNENGIKDSNESYANRIEVELLKSDGTKAVDVNGNEVPNMLTDENGKYSFSNLPMGEYIVKIYTDDQYTLTTANVGSNQEINSKFEETESGDKESYTITTLNGIQSPEIIEQNVNAGLVVRNAKVIVHYLEEDNTPDDDSDNTVLKAPDEITQHEVNGEMKNYKLGDSYTTEPAQIENYITLRNSGNTTGTFESEVVEVTYYYTYNKQDITVRKVWNDNSNEAEKRPTSIKVDLKNGNNVVQEVVLSTSNANSSDANTWEATLNNIDIYDTNGQKINYTVDEKENEGTLENYNKTIDGYTITNTFTQNTEKININVDKVWDDNSNYAGKRPEELTLILKQEETSGQERSYQEVTRATINGTDNQGSNSNEWTYTFEGMPKYDEYNNEINYTVEEVEPEFYTGLVEKVENQDESSDNLGFKITNTFSVPDEKVSIPVTKVWNDNNNRAGKRPASVTLVLTGKDKEGNQVGEAKKITLTSANAIEGNANTWQGEITDLPKYDDKADEINYELSEELDSIFYTKENSSISGNMTTGYTITNRFVVPDDKIEIEVNKKWDDNNNSEGVRPESVTLYLSGNNQEYNVTLTEENKKQDDESVWQGTIGNLPKYDVNGNEIAYTLDERPVANEFYTKTNVDQESKTVTNRFEIPTESIQVPVTKVWDDNNNNAGKRPQTIELQIINKATREVVGTQIMQGNSASNDGWSYTFEVPKYAGTTEEAEYEIGEKDLGNKFYTTNVDQENRTITNKFVVPDEKVNIDVTKSWVDTAEQQDKRPTSVTVGLKANGAEVSEKTLELNAGNEWKGTFTDLQKYDSLGNEINYTVEEKDTGNEFYKVENSSVTGDMTSGYTITNTFVRPNDTVDVTVNKYWNDNNNEVGKRPAEITLKLTGTGEGVNVSKEQKVTASNVGTDSNTWTYTFEGLDKYDENGNEINYTADEENSGSMFYQKEQTITGNMEEGYTITNTFKVPTDTISVPVVKVWDDNGNVAGKRPTSVDLVLTGNDGSSYRQTLTVDNANESDTNKWEYTFTGLPKYNQVNGDEVVYTLSEENLNSKFYIANVNDAEKTVTNTFSLPDEKTSVTAKKYWDDNSNSYGRRPTSVTLTLTGTGEGINISKEQEVTVANASNGDTNTWEYTFDELPKYDNYGNEVVYTINEKDVDSEFYIKSNVDQEARTITNTFQVPGDKVDVTVTKVWDDNNNIAGKRPASVTLQVKNGDNVVASEVVTEADSIDGDTNKWSHTFSVPKYNEQGQEINYTADEANLGNEFYTTENKNVSGDMTNGYTITNKFVVPDATVKVPVTKVWDDNGNSAGKRPEKVTLKLTGSDGQEYPQELNSSNIVEGNTNIWGYLFTNLPKYDADGNEINYTVSEEDTGSIFYTKANSEVTGNMTDGYKVTNTFEVPNDTVSVNVSKTWVDTDKQQDKRPESITAVLMNGDSEVSRQDLGEVNGWTYTFTNLAKYDSLGNEINYTVKEEGTNEFYQETDVSGDMESGYTITNTFTRPTETVDLTVNKVWADNNDEAGKRPSSVTLKVSGNGVTKTGEVSVANAVDGDTNKWAYTFSGLDKYDENGNEIVYTVDEEALTENAEFYLKTVDQASKTVTNTFTVPGENTTVRATKVWSDNENEAGKRPTSVTVQLKNGENVVLTEEANAENNWQVEFTAPKYDSLGNVINYTVDEADLGNIYYTKENSSISGDMTNGFTITNKFVVPDEKVSVNVSKEWSDTDAQKDKRPSSVTAILKNGDSEVARQELNDSNNWSYTFDNLAKYDSLGNSINYTVEEKDTGNEFYTAENSIVTGNMTNGYVITNKFVRPSDTVNIIANKVWNDTEEQAARRPESVTLVVKNAETGAEVASKVVDASNLVAGTTNKWSVEFEGLDKYDSDGNEIKYTLEEKETNSGDLYFYQAEANDVAVEDNQATIRNNFVKPDDTVDVQVTKIWDDQNDKYGKRPQSVYLTVTGNGKTYRQLVTAEEKWTNIFEDLPKYDDNGKEIYYTAGLEKVNEGDLKFYSPEVTTGDMQEGYEIESGFRVPDDTIELTVNKVWQDNSTQSLRRPSVVTINVLGEDGSIVATYDLNTTSETSHTFINLPKYNTETGKEINYTVQEAEKNPGDLHFYTTVVGSVTNVDENSKQVTITNKFVKPNDTTSVTVTKVWNDNNNTAGKRPASIRLLLKDGTETIREQEVNASNEVSGNTNRWTYTFEDVALYDDNGQEKVYTVDEEEVNSGDLQFYDKNITGLTVTNTFTQNTEKVDVPVTKVWDDNETQSARRPSSVIIVLKANGEEKDRIELSSEGQEDENNWKYTFEDLPKYDENNNIINYTVEEQEVNSGDLKFYTTSVDGYTITNTFTRPEDTMSLTVNKVWQDQENVYNKRPLSVRVNVRDSKGLVQTAIITKDNMWEHTFTNLPKYDENGVEISYTVDEEEVIENDLFYYSGSVGTVSKVSENSLTVTITNKMIKIPGTVTVKYVDKVTGEEISDALVKEGVVDNTFDISGDAKDIEGYTLIEEPPVKTGNYSPENQEFTYYYAKNTDVVVKYLEKDDTPDDNTDNVKLAEEVEIPGYEGMPYDATSNKKDIEGYTLVGNSSNLTGTMTRGEIEVIYYYSKNTSVVVKYLEKDNTPTDTSDNKVLLPEKTINGYVGKDYTTTSETIPGYTLVEKTTNFEGTMTKEKIEVVYYYLKNTSVTVRYLEKDNTESDSDNKELVPDITISGYVGKDYETEQKDLSGYTFVEVKGETSGTMTEEGITVVYYYAQNTKVTVQHIDRETNEILATDTINGKVGDVAHTQSKDFEGYVLVESPKEADVVMDKTGTQVVRYYYAHVSGGVIEKHIDEITGNVIEQKLHEGNEGDSYNIPSKTFTGYDLVTDKLPDNSTGTMKRDEVIEVKYYYIKRAKVVVHYVDESTGEEISDEDEITGHENDSYTTKAKEFKGYNLVGDSGNTSGKMVVTVNEDGTFNIETEVTYYYKKVAGGVVVNHIDVATGKVLDNERYDGNVGDSYETSSKDISGYDLVTDRLPENSKGTMTEGEITVNYYYEKKATVEVQYIDKQTGEKLDEEEITGHVGDEYTTEEKTFDGYDLVEKPVNSSGEMTEEKAVVKYYYSRKAEVTVLYIEKATGYEIAQSDEINGYVGDSYETEGKEIPYYNLIEKTENWKGTMTEEGITVIYYYEKQVFNLGVDKWVGSVSVNGISTPAQSITTSNEMYKVDVHRTKADTASIKITYKIRITNNGEIEGTVGKITDIIPAGTTYNQEDNSIYWDNNNGILTTDELKDETIKPGEYKEIEITLRVNKGSENFGQKDNMVILTEISNPAGFPDTNKDDNHDTSSMLLTIATGLDRNDRIAIIGIVQIVLAITIGLLLSYEKKEKPKKHIGKH